MQDLAVLAAFYGEIDTWLEAKRTHALASGDQAKVDRIETKQRLNDQAYFVLCWGQLELEIDNASPRPSANAKRTQIGLSGERGTSITPTIKGFLDLASKIASLWCWTAAADREAVTRA